MHTDKNRPDFSSLFYYNPLPSWVYNPETFKILDVNQAAINHYGFSKEEFIGMTLKDLRPQNEIPKLIAAHLNIKEHQGNIYFGVFTHQIKSGDLIRMKINGHKVDYLGKECMMAVCQDITEEEDQVRLLQESEERLKAASAIAKLGYWRLDLVTNILSWNDEVFNIWGRDKNHFELNYENFLATVHPDDREAFEKEQNAALAGEKDPDNIHRIILPDKSVKWVHELGRLVRDGQGKVIAFEGTVQDITVRKDEEQRLKLLESVITHTNDAIMITEAEPFDEQGNKIIYVNKAFTKMTGYTAEEIIGKSPRILQGPNSDKEELAKFGKAIRNWESCEMTIINYNKNGEEFWVNINVSPVADEKGCYTHWIAVERDVTEQKNKERQKELLGKISLDFCIGNDLNTSVNALCETISEFTLFDFVELWLPNLEKTQIQLVAYKSNTEQANIFYNWSKNVKSFYLAEGLPGIVWHKKRAVLWKDISKNDDFIRKEAAEKADIETALGIPLFFDQKVVGVLVIGTQRDITYLKKYVKVFEQFNEFIGSEISRKKLENDLSHLYDAIPDIICITDLKGRFLKINKAGCELIGYSEEEILYNTFEKFVHPEDKESSNGDLIKLVDGKKTFGFENRYITKKGEIVWLNWTSNSNFQEGLIYATARNITSEKKLREINRLASKLSRIGSWEIDLIGNKLFWSDMVHELHQTDPEKFIPDLGKVIDFYREDFRSLVNAEVNKCIQTGAPFDFEAILITTQNNERWVRAIGNAEMIDGKCHRVYGSFQDIHEQKTAEHQKNSLQATLENSLNEIYIFDADTFRFSYVNRGALSNLGYSEHEINALTPIDLKPEFTSTSFNELVTPLINFEKEKLIFYTNHKRKNGTLYPVEVHLQFVAESNNKRFLAIILDITERKNAETRLLQANERFEKVTEATNDAIWDWDLINKTFFRSNGIEKFFGERSPRQLVENDFWKDKFHQEDLENIKKSIQQAISDPLCTRWESEYRIYNDRGEIVYVVDRGVIIRDKEGNATRMVGSMTNITERKNYENQLLELNESIKQYVYELELSNEELEQFAYIASHDLQEPLRMIYSFMDLLKRKYGGQLDEKAHQYIDFAADGAKRMKQIILDLLNYSRAGKINESKELVDLNELHQEYLQLRRKIIEEQDAIIICSNLPKLETCRAAITQIFHCLLDNAIKYTKESIVPKIEIAVVEKENVWEFSVKDNGIGINPEFFDKIFVIFQRLHNKGQYGGTGIGLSIAKKHVEFLGGKIWVESKPGQGSVFYFTILKSNQAQS